METVARARGLAGWARRRALGDSVSAREVGAAKVPSAYTQMTPRSVNASPHHASAQRAFLIAHAFLIASRQILKNPVTHSQQKRKHFLIASFSAVSAPAPHLTRHLSRTTHRCAKPFLFRTNKPHRIIILPGALLKTKEIQFSIQYKFAVPKNTRFADDDPRITSHDSRITSHKSQVTNHESRSQSRRVHVLCGVGGCSNVCITTQYCSVFSRSAAICSAVAPGAAISKFKRMFSNPTGTSLEIPSVPRRSKSPSTVTSIRSVGMLIAAATIWQVICAQAASAPSSKSPEQAPAPAPPTPLCASAWWIARPISTEQAIGAPVCAPFARIVIREALGSARYCSFSGFCKDRRSMAPSFLAQTSSAHTRRGFRFNCGPTFLKRLYAHASMTKHPENAHAQVRYRTRSSRSRRINRRPIARNVANVGRRIAIHRPADSVAAQLRHRQQSLLRLPRSRRNYGPGTRQARRDPVQSRLGGAPADRSVNRGVSSRATPRRYPKFSQCCACPSARAHQRYPDCDVASGASTSAIAFSSGISQPLSHAVALPVFAGACRGGPSIASSLASPARVSGAP